uniref:Uncharacterized protein n=1 Tax=Candidatus Kentrum sp. FW TaxID=2126338 RepID=A0A450SNW5_9GAMM|nr:MAG: hypothetical protein BECKFW1821A_GA0114235_105418 [Candidatus Kentron sp. FW]
MTACMVPDATAVLLSMTSRLKRTTIENFVELENAINLIKGNPLTISLKGRNKLISKVLHKISGFSRSINSIIVIDDNIVRDFNSCHFSNEKRRVVNVETNLTVYVYQNGDTNLKEASIRAVATVAGFVFRLLLHAQTVIKDLIDKNNEGWFECILMSALIQSLTHREAELIRKTLTDKGEKILDCMVFYD